MTSTGPFERDEQLARGVDRGDTGVLLDLGSDTGRRRTRLGRRSRPTTGPCKSTNSTLRLTCGAGAILALEGRRDEALAEFATAERLYRAAFKRVRERSRHSFGAAARSVREG